jgi:hypothetical protein
MLLGGLPVGQAPGADVLTFNVQTHLQAAVGTCGVPGVDAFRVVALGLFAVLRTDGSWLLRRSESQ